LYLELRRQLGSQEPTFGATDELLHGVDERAETGKVNAPAGPEVALIKLGQRLQRIELASVRVAREIR
jgi:hypothetical protein